MTDKIGSEQFLCCLNISCVMNEIGLLLPFRQNVSDIGMHLLEDTHRDSLLFRWYLCLLQITFRCAFRGHFILPHSVAQKMTESHNFVFWGLYGLRAVEAVPGPPTAEGQKIGRAGTHPGRHGS